MIIISILLFSYICYMILKAYNNIVKKRNQVENAFAGIDAILKNRYDLLPNLVETAKQYMQFEENMLTKITMLRNSVVQKSPESSERIEQENQLSSLLGKVLVTVENYPDLKSNTNMLHLQQSLMEIEEQVSAARRNYNAAAMSYNNAIETIPSNIIAGIIGAKRKTSFEIPVSERQNVSVKELFDAK